MTQVDKFNKAIEKINNINPKIYQELYDNVYKHNLDIGNYTSFASKIREYLKLNTPATRYSEDYWLKRGWSILETKTFIYNNPKTTTSKSPFSVEHWIEKGYSIEDAEYKRNSFRPIRKEYWLERGFDEETSVKKAFETKDTNNKKGASINKIKDKSVFKLTAPRCKEYWLIKGFSEADAIKEVENVQATFSLEKCIDKHGLDEGTKIWQTRQDKWQNTLKSKSQEETDEINLKKNSLDINNFLNKYGEKKGIEKFEEYLINRNLLSFKNLYEIEEHIKKLFIESPNLTYYPPDKLLFLIKDYYFTFVEKPKDIISWLSSIVELKNLKSDVIFKDGGRYGYKMYVENKLLRSSNEIYFYFLLIDVFKLKYKIDFEIEKYYNNSLKRCDFYLIHENKFIELAGFKYNKDYKEKMIFKNNNFDSIILWNQKEYKPFLEEILC